METVVLSLGGSLIHTGEINLPFLKGFKDLILKQEKKFIIITGGGKVCRQYIEASKLLSDAPNRAHDWIGIRSTALNAELVRSMFYDLTLDTIQPDYTKKVRFKKILVGCGYVPGTSTDFDAVMYAKNYGAKTVINLSNIEYVYDKDPNKFPDAKRIDKISWKDFRKIVGDKWKAGSNFPFDPIASKKASQLKLKVIILRGDDIANLEACLDGKPFKGTVIG
jgi:uridylate kinase